MCKFNFIMSKRTELNYDTMYDGRSTVCWYRGDVLQLQRRRRAFIAWSSISDSPDGARYHVENYDLFRNQSDIYFVLYLTFGFYFNSVF